MHICALAARPRRRKLVGGADDFRFVFHHKSFDEIKINNLGFWYERLGGFFMRIENMNENIGISIIYATCTYTASSFVIYINGCWT